MIKTIQIFLICFFSILCIYTAEAQENQFTKKYKEGVIQRLCELMNDYYVFPEVAQKTSTHLLAQMETGYFDEFDSDESFAKALTESVQSINKDKHMRIMTRPPFKAVENSPERTIEETLHRRNRSRNSNLGLSSVKILDGNVGYLDLRGFAGMESGKSIADAYMKLLANSDAIIVDLSKNGGGSPSMVQYLCSYFFNEKVHLNSLYYREGDETIEYWTLDEIGGTKMPETPLFVITGERTFSGAEEFSYNMQTQKRATLIGQTSGGGANPGGTRGLNDMLSVFIPTGKAINPITNTNWEGVGVIPEFKTEIEDTFEKAHAMAMKAAEDYRNREKEKFSTMYMDLHEDLDGYEKGDSEDAILQGITKCIDSNLMQEWNVNALGYDYLINRKKPEVASIIFKSNIILFPKSANAHDSYAECLGELGQTEAALINYQKAIDLAKENEDRDLDAFKKNLANFKSRIAKK